MEKYYSDYSNNRHSNDNHKPSRLLIAFGEILADLGCLFIAIMICSPIIFALIGSLIYWPAKLKVTGHQWQTSIVVKTINIVRKTSLDSYPKNSKIISMEDKGRRGVLYTYEVEEWKNYQTLYNHGKKETKIFYLTDDEVFKKSEIDLSKINYKIERKEPVYFLLFTHKGEEYKKMVDKPTWDKIKKDQVLDCEINIFKNVRFRQMTGSR